MKVRMGFVSNSSSSSFTGITTIDEHDKAMVKLSEEDREVIKAFPYKKVEKFGQTFIIVSKRQGDDYGGDFLNDKDVRGHLREKYPEEDEWDVLQYVYEEVWQPFRRYTDAIEEMISFTEDH